MNTALNAGIFLVASAAIQGIAKALDSYIHRVENARQRTDELFDEFRQMNNTLADHKKTVSELADRYDELSQGVNLSNNANVSLSTKEYEEFLNINEQLANSFPELAGGIDENGNSILVLGTKSSTAKEQLEELLQTEEKLNNFKIGQELTEVFKGVYTYIDEADTATEKLNGTITDSSEAIHKLQNIAENGIELNDENGQLLFSGNTNNQAELAYMNILTASVNEFWRSLDGSRRVELDTLGINDANLFVVNRDDFTGVFEIYSQLYNLTPEEITTLENIIQDNICDISGSLLDTISDQSQKLHEQVQKGENAWLDFVPNLVSGMKSKQTYKDLDSDLQNIAIQLVEGLDYSYASAMNEYDPDPYAYIRDKLIVPMGNLNDSDKKLLQSSYEDLLQLDAFDLSDNNRKEITRLINTIAAILEKDPIKIRAALGFDVGDDTKKRLQNSIRQITDDHGISDRAQYSALAKYTKNFTVAEAELWLEATNGAQNASLAIEMYKAKLEEAKNATDDSSATLSISQTIDQLNTRLKPALDSLQSAYQNIFTDDGFTLDHVNVDMLDSIRSSISELNSLEGVDINIDSSAFEDFAQVLCDTSSTSDEVKKQFDQLANTIVYATGSATVNTETFDVLLKSLEGMGLVNARDVLEEIIQAQQEFNAVSKDLGLTLEQVANATYEETVQLLAEAQSADLNTQALWKLAVAHGTITDGTIATESNVDALLTEAQAAGLDAAMLTALENVRNGNIKDTNAAQAIMEQARQDILASMHDFKLNFDIGAISSSAAKAGAAAASSYTDAFEEDLQSLDSLRDRGVIDEKEYLTRLRALYERYFKDKTQYAEQYAKYERQYLDGMKSLYDSALSGVSKLMSHQIDGYTEAKEAAVASLEAEKEARLEAIEAQKEQLEAEQDIIDKRIDAKQELIDGIQKEIDAMKDARAERQRQLDLQKAQYELESMKNQRTILLYSREKGMHYVADDSAVRDAQEKVDDAEFDIEVSQKEKEIKLIEQEIDLLEEQKEAIQEQIDALDGQAERIEEYYSKMIAETEKYYDSLISNTEKQKSKWEELAEVEEIAQAYSAMKQVFGDMGYTVQDILNGNEQAFEDFKSKYVSLLSDMNNNANFAEGLSYATGISEENLGSFLDKTKAVGTGIDELSSKSSSLGIVAEGMDGIATSATNANTQIAEAVANVGNVAANVGDLSTSLSTINTLVTDELTAFDTLKQTINDVIEAINQKTQALQNGQAVAGVAITTGIGYFILLKEKILELQECISNINLAVMTLDRTPIDNLTDAFRHLYDQILLVSTTLGGGGQETGALGSITSAIQALNGISLEKGIIAQLANLKTAIDGVASAIGGGGESSGSEVLGKSASLPVGNSDGKGSGGEGGGNSLTAAISQMGDTAKKVIGDPDAEGDGTVIGEFGSMKTAVTDVTSSIGNGDSEGAEEHIEDPDDEGDGNLINSIISLGDKTKEVLGEPGGDGVIGRFEQFKQPISDADNHVQSIARGLEDIDGQQVECTIKIHVESDGSLPGGGILNTTMHTESGEYTADYGSTHPTKQTTGTITTSSGLKLQLIRPGDSAWALQEAFAPLLQEMQHHLVASAMYEQRRQTEQTLRDITAANMVYNSRNIQPAIHGGVHITCPGVTSQEVARQVGAELNHMFHGLHNYADQQSSIR